MPKARGGVFQVWGDLVYLRWVDEAGPYHLDLEEALKFREAGPVPDFEFGQFHGCPDNALSQSHTGLQEQLSLHHLRV